MSNSDGLWRLWLELPKTDQRFMKSTSIDTSAIACLGIINAVRPVPSLRVSLIGTESHRDSFLTKYQTAGRHKMQKAE